jgi:hypothetical protein
MRLVMRQSSSDGSLVWRPSVGPRAASGEPRPTTSGEPRPTGAGSGDPRPTTSGEPRPTMPEGTTDGGLDKHVTNETNSAENVSLSQPTGEIIVTTNPGVGPVLDKPENEANGEVRPMAMGVGDSRDGEGVRGARAPTEHRVRAPAAAVSRPGKKKAKRDGRQERKALTRRELERRLQAYQKGGGSVAKANKLIDDLNAVTRQAFRDLMRPAARGP